MRVRYTPRAQAQIEEAFLEIERRSPRAAQAFLDRIDHLANLLAEFPRMGRRSREANVHSFPLHPFPYRIFYAVRPGGDEITIIRLRHSSRSH